MCFEFLSCDLSHMTRRTCNDKFLLKINTFLRLSEKDKLCFSVIGQIESHHFANPVCLRHRHTPHRVCMLELYL